MTFETRLDGMKKPRELTNEGSSEIRDLAHANEIIVNARQQTLDKNPAAWDKLLHVSQYLESRIREETHKLIGDPEKEQK